MPVLQYSRCAEANELARRASKTKKLLGKRGQKQEQSQGCEDVHSVRVVQSHVTRACTSRLESNCLMFAVKTHQKC
jgi:hypothetical protein